MKTIYSLKEFHNEVCKLAPLVSPEHISVKVEVCLFSRVLFSAYISGFNWYDGSTMEECLFKTRSAVCPTYYDKPNIDIDTENAQQITVEDIIPF